MISNKCIIETGTEKINANKEEYKFDGDCENCALSQKVGIYTICMSSAILGARVIPFDCVVSSLKSKEDKNVRCLNCKYFWNPKTKRCSECVETPNLKNFKKYEPGRFIYDEKD